MFEYNFIVEVSDRQVNLLNLGPAYTATDSVAYVPDTGVLLTMGSPVHWVHPGRVGRADRQPGRRVLSSANIRRAGGGTWPLSSHRFGRDLCSGLYLFTSPNKPKPPSAQGFVVG